MKKNDFYKRLRRMAMHAVAVAILLVPISLRAQQGDSLCAPLPLPWFSSFELDGYDALEPCWSPMAQSGSYPFIYRYGYAHSGSCSMALFSDAPGSPCMLATPLLAHRADSLHVGFHLVMNDGTGQLLVGMVADTSDTASFTPFLTLDLADATSGYYEFYTDGYTAADTQAVAFKIVGGRVLIDDVEVEASGTCRRPWHPVVQYVQSTFLSLAWSSPSAAMPALYVIRCIDTASFDTLHYASADTSYILTGLTPATTYHIEVAAVCSGDTTSWMDVGYVVTDVACRQPYSFTVGAWTATAAVLQWEYDRGGYVQPSGVVYSLYDMTSSSSFGDFNADATENAIVTGLTTGHRYRATLQAVCQTDTSSPLTVSFTPLAPPCSEQSSDAASSSLVVAGASRYSYSQMLYPSTVLGGADTLFGIALRVDENEMVFPRMLTVYAAQKADSMLEENMVSPLMTMVADSIELAPGFEGWKVIPFNAPWAVDTALNLVITVLDNTGNPTGRVTFGVHTEAFGNTLYLSSQTQPVDPSSFNLTAYTSRQVADIMLYGTCAASSACLPPAPVVAASAADAISLVWAGGSGAMALRYAAEGDDYYTTVAVSGTGYTLSGLNASTRYVIEVGNICGTDTMYAPPLTAATQCGSVAVPYAASFLSGANPCWEGTQYEALGGVIPDGLLLSPLVAVQLATLQLRLSVASTDPSAMLRVGVADAAADMVQWVDSIMLADVVGGEWVAYFDGCSGSRIAILCEGRCVLASATIEPLDPCLAPRGLLVSGTEADRATIVWQGTASHYDIAVGTAYGDEWHTWSSATNTFTINGLTPQTSYIGYVVSRCDSVSQPSRRSWFRFTTPCGAISYFPYHQDFESADPTLGCWTVEYADPACATVNPIVYTAERHFTGLRSLRFSSYTNIQSDNYDQYFISPRLVASDSVYLSFRCYKDNYDSEPFQVGFSVYGSAVEDFLWMGEVEPQAGTWTEYSIGLPAATRYVAIRYMGRGNYYLYIDDLAISGPGCASPQITMVDEQATSVTVGWEADADSTIVAITDGLWLTDIEGTTVAGDTYTFSSLPSGRRFTIGLRFRCPDGNLSEWVTRRVSTIDMGCAPPDALAVDSLGYDCATLSWQPGSVDAELAVYSDGVLLWQSQRQAQPWCYVPSLEQNSTYSAIVRSVCSDIPGPWSDTLHFTTLQCATVSSLEYERVDFRTIIVSWEEASVSTGLCRVEYGPEGFSQGTGNVVVAQSPCRLSNLDPYANYEIYVQNYCTATVYSDSTEYLYVPNGVGIAMCDGIALSLSPNPATDVVTLRGLGTDATVTLTDAVGRRLGVWHSNAEQLTIDVSSLVSGTYFVCVVSATGTAVGKLVISE